MAHLEVRKGGKLVQRRQIDSDKARRGCRIRLGSLGSVDIKAGETATLGNFEIKLIDDISESASAREPSSDGRDINVLTFSQAKEAKPGRQAAKEWYSNAGYPNIEGYEIINQLGEGGMGTVWRAFQLSTKRHVAMKLLGNRYFTSKSAQARFEREVSLSAKLTHPNIARIYDSGLHEGIYYYVMELLEGRHLDKYVLEEDLDQREILSLIAKVCMAVEYAHSEGIIHRDLKPSNIIVTSDGEPHVLDFGLAKTLEKDSGDITLSIEGQITGTLSYMSPEQAKGNTEAIGEQSDIYSLGVILFQMLTGTMPHDMSGSRLEKLKRIAEQEVINPRSVNNKINRDIEAILLKALALDPHERYPSMAEFAQEIENYLTGKAVSARSLSTIYVLRKPIRHNQQKILSVLYLSTAILAAIGAIWFFLYRYVTIQDAIKRQNEQIEYLEGELSSQEQNKLKNNNPINQYMPYGPYQRPRVQTTQKARRENEAGNIIMEIEVLIAKKNLAKAQSLFEQLKKDYSDTEQYQDYKRRMEWRLKSQIEKGLKETWLEQSEQQGSNN